MTVPNGSDQRNDVLDDIDVLAAKLAHTDFRFVAGHRALIDAGRHCQFHQHAGIEVVYHASGNGVSRTEDGTESAFSPGSVDIYPAGCVHAQTQVRAGEDYCLVVRTTQDPPPFFKSPRFLPFTNTSHLLSELVELSVHAPSPNSLQQLHLDRRATALMIGLVEELAEAEQATIRTVGQQYAEQTYGYIAENCRSLKNVSDVAGALGLSTSRLRQVFTTHYGFGPQQWLITCRIEYAKSLLREFSEPLKTVAAACGFANERYFCTCFRRITGLTPGKFRKMCHTTPRPH